MPLLHSTLLPALVLLTLALPAATAMADNAPAPMRCDAANPPPRHPPHSAGHPLMEQLKRAGVAESRLSQARLLLQQHDTAIDDAFHREHETMAAIHQLATSNQYQQADMDKLIQRLADNSMERTRLLVETERKIAAILSPEERVRWRETPPMPGPDQPPPPHQD
ncbi:hypothetical protein [uncultured Aquitalea sp.]|uniref:hypothetical protein n=1 Tax=uncultured Aquitalea sp. TaxID=540272 RepID=UPI0025DAC502|nr:hypothetical protein [uncultured Aquitalea sp.]